MNILKRFRRKPKPEPQSGSPDSGLYRVRYVDLAGFERTMTARPAGGTKIGARWVPVWALDPSDQLGPAVGPIRDVVGYERIGE